MPRIIHPTDIKIPQVGGMTMTSLGSGASINVFNIIQSFDIYESIYANVICADFVFADGVGLLMSFPIIGEEVITIDMETPGVEGTIYTFHTTEVVSIRDNEDSTLRTYVVRAVSKEFHVNMYKQYTKRYKDDFQFCINDAFDRLDSDKGLEIEVPLGFFDFLVREARPMQVLDLLKERALAPPNHKSSHYVFFQDKYEFRFVTTEFLVDKWIGAIGPRDPVAGTGKEFWMHNRKWQQQGGAELPSKKNILAFENVSIGSDVDKISASQLNSTTRSYDIKHGIVSIHCHEEKGYTYTPFSGSVRPLNTEQWRGLYNAKPARRFFLFRDTFRLQDKHEVALGPKRAFQNLMERNALKIRVYGRTDITAGMMVRLNLPYVSGFQDDDKRPWVSKYEDPLFGESYMVVELKHQISMDAKSREYNHYMILVCAKPHHIEKPTPFGDNT